MKFLKCLLLVTTFSFGISTLSAQEYNNNANVYAGGVYYLFDDEHNQKDDLGFLLGGEIPVAERWGLAAEYWSLDSVLGGSNSDSDVNYLRVGSNYHLQTIEKWQPYLSIGLGRLNITPSAAMPKTKYVTADLGAGFKYALSNEFMLRGDIKTLFPSGSSDIDFTFGLSLAYTFGAKAERRLAPVSMKKEDAPQIISTSTPQPAPLAPVDSDQDGVYDEQDACPATPVSLAVDSVGCPILEVSQMRQTLAVNFDTNQSIVKAEYESEMATFAAFMKTYSNTNVIIEGHTDSDGKAEYNQNLSEQRAISIRDELINRYNIQPSRISAIGYGETRPVASNNTKVGKARNRRIDAEVSAKVETQRMR